MSTDEITDVRLLICGDVSRTLSEDDVFVEVASHADVGCYGPVSRVVGSCIERLAPLIIGSNPLTHSATHKAMSQADSKSHVYSWAIGALDCAMWDLHGRIVGQPVSALLGNFGYQPQVPVYASFLSDNLGDDETKRLLCSVPEEGWAFTKWALRRSNSLPSQGLALQFASDVESAAAQLQQRIAVDAVRTWTLDFALDFAHVVDKTALLWLEDPLASSADSRYEDLTSSGIPLGLGESMLVHDDAHLLMTKTRVVALTIDVLGCGGLTQALDVVRMAEALDTPVYPHGRSFVPGLHLAAAFPKQVPGVEYRLQWEPSRQNLYEDPWTPEGGLVPMPPRPGLGSSPRGRA